MYNIATKKRLKLGKTTVRELNDHEGAMVGGGIVRAIPRPSPINNSLACSVTPSNPPPGGMPPTATSGTINTNAPKNTDGVCGSKPSICLCVPTRNSYECR
jgi:hypothetical protein